MTIFPSINLSGLWRVALDPDDSGEREGWHRRAFPDRIELPGTLDEAGIGAPNIDCDVNRLSRLVTYAGPAWYSREIEMPEAYPGDQWDIVFERCLWRTSLWLDDRFAGTRDSLQTPHVYRITAAPGRHRLTLRVDNRRQYELNGHAYSQMQTIWNGVLGWMEASPRPIVSLDDAQVFPSLAKRAARIKLGISNPFERRAATEIKALARCPGRPDVEAAIFTDAAGGESTVEMTIDLGDDAPAWDEFAPNLYSLDLELTSAFGRMRRRCRFGLRDIAADGRRLLINGRPMFLRGEQDAGGDSLRGHPPANIEAWYRIFQTARAWGINHFRFHSWCPSEAAFVAADELGIYLQPELALNGTLPQDQRTLDYVQAEMRRILQAYGNHPSFVFFSNGNELSGDNVMLRDWIRTAQAQDPRRLYALGTNAPWEHPTMPSPGDPEQIFVGSMVKEFDHAGKDQRGLLRGSYHLSTLGHVNNAPPSTRVDYEDAVALCPVPAVSHEIGQYCAFPNFREIEKHGGVLRARNYEVFRDRLAAAGMMEQADDFVRASGALQWRLYKEEIEAALRTRGMAGFQLLDLRDFQDQGTAVVGMLDSFWEQKEYISPERFRAFCGPTVLLLRLDKLVWHSGETLEARAQVAHYGADALSDLSVDWTIASAGGDVVAAGALAQRPAPTGDVTDLGVFRVALGQFNAPGRYTVSLQRPGVDPPNTWDVWIYPERTEESKAQNVLVAREWSDDVRVALERGARVALLAAPESLRRSVAGGFQTEFWSYPMFKHFDPPGTLGLLCDPAHPCLGDFPTESHSDWQWWDLTKRSRPMIFDGSPREFRPIVQVIDNFERNHKLGLLAEAKVGEGRLLICSIDLNSDLERRFVARQLRCSILGYAASEQFDPQVALSADFVEALFTSQDAAALQAETAVPALLSWHLGEVKAQTPGFAVEDAAQSSFSVVCPPAFNGRIRVKVAGEGECRVVFQGKTAAALSATADGAWAEVLTAQNAWSGRLSVEILAAQPPCRLIEWAVLN